MSWGRLYPTQKETLRQFVEKRIVHDLGAGELELAAELARLGADVIAVDKEVPSRTVCGVKFIQRRFIEFDDLVETAFISWPTKYGTNGLVEILKRAKTVIYLGHNLDGTCCGDADMWEHLRARQILALDPQQRNTLIVYGEELSQPRAPLLEERAATDHARIYRFTEWQKEENQ